MTEIQSFQTQSDILFYKKLYESMKGIFSMQKQEWTCEQILRFLTLIKVESKLQTFFYEFKITGHLLFDLKYLWKQLAKYLQTKTYFPIMKLLYLIMKINFMDSKSIVNMKFVRSDVNQSGSDNDKVASEKDDNGKRISQKAKNQKSSTSLQSFSPEKRGQQIQDDQNQQGFTEKGFEYVTADGQILQTLSKQFAQLGQVLIADLSSNQLSKIFKSTQNQKAIILSELIKKYAIDGYCVIFLLSDREQKLQQIASFFNDSQIQQFEQILNLILPFYYKQIYDAEQKSALFLNNKIFNVDLIGNSQPKTASDFMNDSKASFGTSQMGTSQMGTSQMGTSQIYGQSEAGEQSSVEFGVSQGDQSNSYIRQQSMGQSQMGRSEYAQSVYGQSEYGQSEYATSQYATSERGSIRGSMAESVMGQSVVYEQQHKQKNKNVRISSFQDLSIVNKLKQVALTLPFNLFKMQPLQNLKMTSLNYPFTLNFPKPHTHEDFIKSLKQSVQKLRHSSSNSGICTKDFNITGVKFGRSQQNDYRYPDELSISAKHAQIGFWDNKYQLIDLQSKTGTFLYIPLTKPLVLKDEQIIQLSNEIQIVVHILKKESSEGTIKLEFTKPQNQPFYKATLKENQTLKIGRSQKSHIKLSQQSISSKHTEIKYENQQFKLYDCLSSTGTWLRLSKKGVKSEMFPLQEGDIIRISSKKTYLIERIKNCLNQQDDEDMEQLQGILENPNFKVHRQNSEENFNNIIYNTWKRKTPYQKKKEVHFEEVAE